MKRAPGTAAFVAFVALLVAAACASPPAPPDPGYVESIDSWRAAREERLRQPYGYLSLAGLHWLEPGDNTFGREADNAVVIDADPVPPRAGTFVYDAERQTVHLRPAPGVTIVVAGEPATDGQLLRSDNEQDTDVLEFGPVQAYVVRRGERVGVRVKDPEHPNRTGFAGLDFYDVDPAFRVEGRFKPYDQPRPVPIANIVGVTEDVMVPGEVEFELNGATYSLQTTTEDPQAEKFFFMIRDATSGKETYGAGRYLSAERQGDTLVLDFNKAYNPPCAYTPFATCPLPPPGNRLTVAIRAGERYAGDH